MNDDRIADRFSRETLQNENDPRDSDPLTAQDVDPAVGTSDDPRVDPTPDGRQSADR